MYGSGQQEYLTDSRDLLKSINFHSAFFTYMCSCYELLIS